MASYPFVAVETAQVAANGLGTLSYQVPTNKRFTIHNIIYEGDGAFSITNIQSASSRNHGNLSQSKPLLSVMVQETNNQNNTLRFPVQPLMLNGGDEFSIEFLDTSGSANDITMALNGIMEDA